MKRRDTITVRDTKVSYLEWAPRGEPRCDVLLLHGGGFDSAELSWGDLGARIAARGWRVIAPDAPGYGFSPMAAWRPTQQRLEQHVGDLIAAFELDRPVLGGISLGGGLSLGYALAHQNSVRVLMLFGSYGLTSSIPGSFGRIGHALIWVALRAGLFDRLMARYARSADRATIEKGISRMVRNPASRTPELIDALADEMARHRDGLPAFGMWQRDQTGPLRLRTDYSNRLTTLRVPTLIVHGEADHGVPVKAAFDASGQIPDATLAVAQGAGHWVQRDAPEVSAEAVTRFLGAVECRGRRNT